MLDEAGTWRFLVRLEALKPVRKGRKAVLAVANRVRPRSRALGRLETFLAEAGHPPTARLTDLVSTPTSRAGASASSTSTRPATGPCAPSGSAPGRLEASAG